MGKLHLHKMMFVSAAVNPKDQTHCVEKPCFHTHELVTKLLVLLSVCLALNLIIRPRRSWK